MKRLHPLPTLLTLGNFGCGFSAIVLAARSLARKTPPRIFSGVELSAEAVYLYSACAVIFLAMLFDLLDGKVARMTGSACRFGAELDSLADVVSFGIAPATILVISWIHVEPDSARWWSMVLGFGFIYAACACLRLARYNVEADTAAKSTFRGLPSPAAAGAVVSMYLLIHQPVLNDPLLRLLGEEWLTRVMALHMLGIGLLMVTRVRYAHLGNRFLGGRKRFTHFVIALFALGLLIMKPLYVLALAFNGYVLHGAGFEIARFLRRHRKQESRGAGAVPSGQDVGDGSNASGAAGAGDASDADAGRDT
ncbi:MAG: CDP-diacylglycerol--serine O-phosphatidyltransferase [Planctomycetota bacterium]